MGTDCNRRAKPGCCAPEKKKPAEGRILSGLAMIPEADVECFADGPLLQSGVVPGSLQLPEQSPNAADTDAREVYPRPPCVCTPGRLASPCLLRSVSIQFQETDP